MLEPVIEEGGFELVDLEWIGSSRRTTPVLRLYIDCLGRKTGVTLDDCAEVSRTVGLYLDQADLIAHAYTLEVSSPGVERRLRKAVDFERFRGREVRVELRCKLEGRRRLRGRIRNVEEGRVCLEEGPGQAVSFPLSQLKHAHLVVDFDDLLGRTAGS
jgi:ribosome maturation factor RimP